MGLKAAIGYLVSWTLYGVGHVISFPMLWMEWAFLYKPYNWLMLKSCRVQDWSGCGGPW